MEKTLLRTQKHLYILLIPFAWIYAFCMFMRRWAYKTKIFSSYPSKIPTVSIGNISWGGTGKTPLIMYLLAWGNRHKIKMSVVSRGYKGKKSTSPYKVSQNTPVEICGDEALLIAQNFPSTTVIVSAKRAKALQYLTEEIHPQIAFLDDAMQHLAVKRDLNIVLLSMQDIMTNWNKVIPSGSWREPQSALKDADIFCIKLNQEIQQEEEEILKKRLFHFQKPIFSFSLENNHITPLYSFEGESPLYKPDLPFIFFCGIGNPQYALNSVEKCMNRKADESIFFPDHHAYTPKDIEQLISTKKQLVCTAKDAIKLQKLISSFQERPVWILETHLIFKQYWLSEVDFDEWWNLKWNSLHSANIHQAS